MRKIFLILIFILSYLHAENVTKEINEYKVDLYYANGIMMMESEAEALYRWQNQVDELVLFAHPELQKFIGKKEIAYNISHGFTRSTSPLV